MTVRLAALLGLLAPALDADVFWRMPSDAGAALRTLGGARVYMTDVEVNGAPGTLAAYAFSESPSMPVCAVTPIRPAADRRRPGSRRPERRMLDDPCGQKLFAPPAGAAVACQP
jgi:hypothetical protein